MNRSPARLVSSGWMFAIAAAVFIFLYGRLWPFMTDDTYISLRYAKNLAEGHGLVYNPGERVEGYTNFLWTLWLAVPVLLHLPIVPFIKISNVLLTIATALVLVPLARATLLAPRPIGDGSARDDPAGGRTLAMLPASLLLATPLVALGAADGLETMLFTFLLVLAATCFFTERAGRAVPLSPLVLAALAMTRPDGALFALWFGVVAIAMRRPRAYVVRFAAVFAITFGIYFALRALYYRQWLPNTFYAKSGGDAFLLHRGWEELQQFVSDCGGWVWLLIPTAWILRRTRGVATVLIGIVLVRVLFQLWSGGPWMGRYRFLVPVLPFVDLLIVAGVAQLVRPGIARVAVASAVGVALLFPGWMAYPLLEKRAFGYVVGLTEGHLALGRAVNAHTRSDAVMAMDDAGIGPLVADRRNLDMLGLNDAHIAHLEGRYAEKFDSRYVLSRRPDLIVLLSYTDHPSQDSDFRLPGHAALFRDPEFQAHYRFMRSFGFDQVYRLLVYRRSGSLAAPEDF